MGKQYLLVLQILLGETFHMVDNHFMAKKEFTLTAHLRCQVVTRALRLGRSMNMAFCTTGLLSMTFEVYVLLDGMFQLMLNGQS